ncbi:MAG: AMP-binding protein [Bacteroidaceae bacterium]|nr:AMP-binding protein [Bacteroidaceae bacterium]
MRHYLGYIDDAIKNYWNNPALTNYGGNTYTYGDIAAGIAKYHILFEKCNIDKGDKIALCGKNSAEWCIAYLAVLTYDAVAVPLLSDFLPKNVVELTRISDSRLILVDDAIMTSFKKHKVADDFAEIENFGAIINVNGIKIMPESNNLPTKIEEDVEKVFATRYPGGVTPKRVNYEKNNLNALSVISFTSGTSSSPKGVMIPARAISANLEFARKEMEAEPGWTILSILPLAHMFGQAFDFIFPFSKGCHIYIFTVKPTPARLLAALAEVKPFMFLTVPLVIEKVFRSKVMPALEKPAMRILMHIPGIKGLVLGKIRKLLIDTFGGNVGIGGIILGGAALNKEVEELMHKMKFPYLVGYGMTECAPLIGYKKWQEFAIRSCGAVARPSVEVRIDSENPAEIPGEIQVHGDAVMVGYYKNEKATNEVFTADGWLKTGDMGTMDANGNMYIRGRCKNMILTANGQNIYPEEIEDMVNQLPYVTESLIVGRKNTLVALVVANSDAATEAGLNEEAMNKEIENSVFALNKELPSYSQITQCEIRKEPFEKTPKLSIKRFMYK